MTRPEPVPLKALQSQHKALVDDLRVQSEVVPKLRELLQGQYAGATKGERTAASYEEWREDQLDQAAVAWLLGTVFVRFCEDNKLISGAWLAGPGGATEAAAQAQTAHFIREPKHTDREWILRAFEHLRELGATAALFDEHNPVWTFDISADAAGALLDFWRRGPGVRSFVDDGLDTRFLGDLYQDLSQYARKRYALLQTPEFVEEFILDLTLTPSIAEYGLEETSLIDPTCGSGHFLIGAFQRLHKLWLEREPGTDPRVRVQKALNQITGVDILPFAVAIARFRLVLAAMQACGERSLESPIGFKVRLAAGDSLLRWGLDTSHQGDLLAPMEGREEFAYFTEDATLLADYLERGQYTAAVGNPPYITVKDKTLNERYRGLYKTCAGKYALTVPFVERFFQLVRQRDESGRAGFVGQITANSFMKREFGKKLIEQYLAGHVELSHVIDTSGAYIPGHGTPTVILVGRRRYPKQPTIRAVLGILGEPSAPKDPAKGLVWTAIIENIDSIGAHNPYVTIADLPRTALIHHPWSLSGGGARALREAIESTCERRLDDLAQSLGITSFTLEDDLFVQPSLLFGRLKIRPQHVRPMVLGDGIRDWDLQAPEHAAFPYDGDFKPLDVAMDSALLRFMWRARTSLSNNVMFGKQTKVEAGLKWTEYGRLTVSKLRTPLSMAWAEVATHNHFVLDRGGKVFKQTAPVIKLRPEASEGDHLGLLGLLNSSAVCFWLKQVSHNKGSTVDQKGARQSIVPWEDFYQFNSTKVGLCPVPAELPGSRARALDALSSSVALIRPRAVCAGGLPTVERLQRARGEYDRVRGKMIAVQEELDWEVYGLYGLLDEHLTAPDESVPALNLGERAFEIVLARRIMAGGADTQWFARHGSMPISEVPAHWPAVYKSVVEQRIQVIEGRSDIALIERPDCKRRWASTPWEVQEKEALLNWLLDRLEAESLWRVGGRARVLSVAQLADRIGSDADFRSVVALYCGRDDYDLTAELVKLTSDGAVPYVAMFRYKESGLRKRAVWERTWELQRAEDEAAEKGEKVDPIPVPPKYTNADFARSSYWRNRGKLDVPKERFVLYPKAGRDADKTPVLGWAGWNHLDQAQALATLYMNRKNDEGWPAQRLLPMLAGLVELEPWLHQWHAEAVSGYPGSPAAFYTNLINGELAALGYGRADLTPENLAWMENLR